MTTYRALLRRHFKLAEVVSLLADVVDALQDKTPDWCRLAEAQSRPRSARAPSRYAASQRLPPIEKGQARWTTKQNRLSWWLVASCAEETPCSWSGSRNAMTLS